MISYLRGKLIESGKNYAIIDVHGVGYRVNISSKALNILAKTNGEINPSTKLRIDGEQGRTIKIYTRMIFNQHEGVSQLYGFLKKDDLEAFDLLTSISGIGPKNAMHILSSMEMEELITAISKEDIDYLRKVSGLGPKTAKRLVMELRDKLDNLTIAKFAKFDLSGEIDAIDALVSLGYQKYQAQEALRKISPKIKGLEGRVKEALRILSTK